MKRLKMQPNNEQGVLITFCGLDGCGKTTMINRLYDDFKLTRNIHLTKQPTDNVRNSQIFRTYMDHEDHSAYEYRSLSLLAASDRVQHVSKVIRPALENGYIVLSDRYFYSCLANLNARGFEQDKWIYEIAGSIIQPDIAFFFDVPVEEAVRRVRSRPTEKERFIDMELQFKLRDQYLKICNKNKGILISTTEPEEVSYEKVLTEVRRVLYEKRKY